MGACVGGAAGWEVEGGGVGGWGDRVGALPTGSSTMTKALRQLDLLDKLEMKPVAPAAPGAAGKPSPEVSRQPPEQNPAHRLAPAGEDGSFDSIVSWVSPASIAPLDRPAKGALPEEEVPPTADDHAAQAGTSLTLEQDNARPPAEPIPATPAREESSGEAERGADRLGMGRESRLGTVLVLGGGGAFGGAVTSELLSRGIPVRLIVRDAPRAWTRFGDDPNLRMVKGDALDPALVLRMAEGCEAIVQGAGGPMRTWGTHLARMNANVIEAARAHGATVLAPGVTLSLGAWTARPMPEAAPARPTGAAGLVRARLEDQFRMAAASESADGRRCRTLLLRLCDCFGPTVRNQLVDDIFARALSGEPMIAWGNPEAARQWAYMPDVARVAVDLLIMGRGAHAFDGFEIINFGGYTLRPARLLYEKAALALGYSRCPMRRRTWLGARVRSLTSAEARERLERRAEFDRGVLLDSAKLLRLFPQLELTPLDEAIVRTLESYRAQASAAGGRPRVQRPL